MSTAPQWPEPRPIEEAPKDGGESACPKCFEGYLESQGKGCLLLCVCCSARIEPNDEVIHYISQNGQQQIKVEVRK